MNYQTTHETAERTMTHHMSAGYKVIVDFKNNLITTLRNGEIKAKQSISGIGSLGNYERHVAQVAEAAEEMERRKI